jgi:hypothetical protein
MTLNHHKTDNQFYHVEWLGLLERPVRNIDNQGKVLGNVLAWVWISN